MLSEEIMPGNHAVNEFKRNGVRSVRIPLPQDRSLRIGNQNWTSRRRSVKTRRVGRRLYIPQWLLAIPPPLSLEFAQIVPHSGKCECLDAPCLLELQNRARFSCSPSCCRNRAASQKENAQSNG